MADRSTHLRPHRSLSLAHSMTRALSFPSAIVNNFVPRLQVHLRGERLTSSFSSTLAYILLDHDAQRCLQQSFFHWVTFLGVALMQSPLISLAAPGLNTCHVLSVSSLPSSLAPPSRTHRTLRSSRIPPRRNSTATSTTLY